MNFETGDKLRLISGEDVKQNEYLEILDGLQSSLFPGLNMKQGLYNESYYCSYYDDISIKKFVFKSWFFLPSFLDIKTANSFILTIYTKNYREDHDTYWQTILDDIGEHNEITILSKFSSNIKRIDLLHALKRIRWYQKSYKELKNIKNDKDRKYLAAQMACRKWTMEQIKALEINPKVVMCFFDSAPDECFLMQYFKQQGAITITNQHSQPVFYSTKYDRVNQSQIFNFKCDYYLAKGEITVRQFLKAGFDKKHFKLVGLAGTQFKAFKFNESGIFGVYLDTPDLPYADYSNPKLIDLAGEVSEMTGLHYFIKVHPNEIAHKYDSEVGENCIGVYGRETNLKDTFSQIEFAITHNSGTYLDAYNAGVRCFKFQTKVEFPIAYKEDIVNNKEELVLKYSVWKATDVSGKIDYLTKVLGGYDSGWKQGNIRNIVYGL